MQGDSLHINNQGATTAPADCSGRGKKQRHVSGDAGAAREWPSVNPQSIRTGIKTGIKTGINTGINAAARRAVALLAASAALCAIPAPAQDADPAKDVAPSAHSLVRPASFPPQLIARLDLDEPTLVDALLDALPTLSRYPRPAEPPRLVYVPTAQLRAQACSVPCPVLAYYAGGRDIFLDHSLNPLISLFDRSVVLHEMVHYLQAQETEAMRALENAGPRERCRIWYAREYEAYEIQQRFLTLVHSRASAGKVPGRSNC